MKVYFTGSISAKEAYLPQYNRIVDYLKAKNHTVTYEHITNSTEESVRKMDRAHRLAFHHKIENWIKAADFMIAETSFPSVSVGYEIALALRLAKPVLVLYSEGDPPSLLTYHSYDRLHTEKYTSENVGGIIDDFVHYIEGKHDTRFTFFLPEEMNFYLEDRAKKKKLTKSFYLRRLIESDMESILPATD
jgi:alpha-beta hydrolase superfamily lysophospholipase